MRTSKNQVDYAGRVYNGYDYDLQVWVRNGRIVPCGHPHYARENSACCNAWKHKYQTVERARLEEGLPTC